MTDPRPYSAPALEKGLDILILLAQEVSPLSMTQVCERLNRSKGEIFRMLLVLEERGFIYRPANADGYLITNKLFLLAMEQPVIKGLLDVALPIMHRLAESTWQSCHLVVASLDEIVVIARVESPGDISYAVRLGHRRPIAQSASGPVLFAFQPVEVQDQWLARLRKSAEFNETQFLAEAKAAKRAQMISRKSLRVRGVVDLAAPILQAGNAIATLVVPHLDQDPVRLTKEQVIDELRCAVDTICESLRSGDSPVRLVNR